MKKRRLTIYEKFDRAIAFVYLGVFVAMLGLMVADFIADGLPVWKIALAVVLVPVGFGGFVLAIGAFFTFDRWITDRWL